MANFEPGSPVPVDDEWYWPGAYYDEHGSIAYPGYPTLCPKLKHDLFYPWSTCRHKKQPDSPIPSIFIFKD